MELGCNRILSFELAFGEERWGGRGVLFVLGEAGRGNRGRD